MDKSPMLFKTPYYDDDRAKLAFLDARVELILGVFTPTPDLVEALALATYDLVLTQIEVYYWDSPHLASRLRAWATAVLEGSSNQLDTNCALFHAIKMNMPAPQLESLLEILDE